MVFPSRFLHISLPSRWKVILIANWKTILVYVYLHLMSNWTDNCSELPTEFCAWHVYKPASRRPTGLSCNVSCARTNSINTDHQAKAEWEREEKNTQEQRNIVIVIISGDLLSKRWDTEHATSVFGERNSTNNEITIQNWLFNCIAY